MPLNLETNIPDADGFYEELINAQRKLDDEQSAVFQAKMLLLLANHVGDRTILTEAMQLAQQGLSADD